MFSKEVTRFYITQYAYVLLTVLLAVILEFFPTRVSQFFEGDLTISHTCGNTVKYSLLIEVMNSTLMVFVYYLIVNAILVIFVCIFVKKTERCNVWI